MSGRRWLRRQPRLRDDERIRKHVVHRDLPLDREHVTNGGPCWCGPEVRRLLPRVLWRTRP